jgi:hypothetical protein
MSQSPALTKPNAPTISPDQAMAIARQDAEKTYRELFRYRITVLLSDDGWHVDYDLTSPTAAGGGPHYVIDSEDGQILAKRYEQ